MSEKLWIFDTTLRDGEQVPGCQLNTQEKIIVAKALEDLGVDIIEAGFPISSPGDFNSVIEISKAVTNPIICALSRAVEKDIEVAGAALQYAKKGRIHTGIGVSPYHIQYKLRSTPEDIIQRGVAAVKFAKRFVEDVEFYAEDAGRAEADFLCKIIEEVIKAGATVVNIPDTTGYCLPEQYGAIISSLKNRVPNIDRAIIATHCHNDLGMATANALAAVDAGVRHIQGTLNGIGERCGNANLVSIIPTLVLKPHFAERFETGIDAERLQRLTHISRAFDELLNRSPNKQSPYVGKSAFATKAGIHASALAKEPETYEHVPPDSVGNRRQVLVSDQAGKSNLIAALQRTGLEVSKDDPRLDGLLRDVKEREALGYAYDGADASFELLARRALGSVPKYFDVISFRVIVEERDKEMISEAVVKVRVDDQVYLNAGEGNGPVNALDVALRKDLGKYQRFIDDMELSDFKVRILNGGTGATTRVLIESRDGKGNRWFTVGVSPNIVDASFQALSDALVYKLVREGVTAD